MVWWGAVLRIKNPTESATELQSKATVSLEEQVAQLMEYYADNDEVISIEPLSRPPTAIRVVVKIREGPAVEYANIKKPVSGHEPGWPFSEYVKEHTFTLVIPPAFPATYPSCFWDTVIPHPNIVRYRGNVVCEDGLTDASLVLCVHNALKALKDPNPALGEGDGGELTEAIRVLIDNDFPKNNVW